jgi:NAD(P)H-dependent flavin oxidoreductase YrpB (nitropropane dioxygenase family)
MSRSIAELTGAEFPLFAFSHCRDVVAAVSRAGGFGVLGGSSFTPETLEEELRWIDEHVDGKPYGIDILIPENVDLPRGVTAESLAERIPQEHIKFATELLRSRGIDATEENIVRKELPAITPEIGELLMDIAFRHPIRLIANALGIAPKSMIDRARARGVPVAALVGAKEHAIRQAKAGVDIIVAQGTEAGGHCGEVSTLVLIPEVVRALEPYGSPPVLAAGGIVTGQQMAGCMAMGAAGAWTGTVWLTTAEAETSEAIREKIVAASSRDTVRSTYRTGKPSRQLKSAWTEAWEGSESPGKLEMPMMGMISGPAFAQIDKAVQGGNAEANDLVSYWVGQGVGLIDSVTSAGSVVQTFKEEFLQATERLGDFLG